MRKLIVWALAFFILAPVSLFAQDPLPQGEEKVVSGTTEVLLDAIVRDKKGRPVKDLKLADFQVTEDGVPQEIKSFRLVSGEAEAGARTAPLKRSDAIRRVREDFNAGRIGAVALVFDHLSLDSRRRAHDAALGYVEAGLSANDFIGVFGIDQSLLILQSFTNDQHLIKDAIERAGVATVTTASTTTGQITDLAQRNVTLLTQLQAAEGSAGEANAATAANSIGSLATQLAFNNLTLQAAQGFERLEQTQQGLASTDGLLALIAGMAKLPGRKAIIYFSEGVTVTNAVTQNFRTVIGNANRANVSVYTVDAVGLRAQSAQAQAGQQLSALGQTRAAQASSGNDNFGSMMRDAERSEDIMRQPPEGGLGELADQTGGTLVSGTNNPGARLRQVNEDLHTYYVLTYSPKNQNFDGKFRQISIKLNRGGTDVQTRKGYYGLPATYDSPVLPYEAPALAILGRATQPSAFASRGAAFSFPTASKPGLVPVVVAVPASAINFVTDPEKKTYHTDFTVAVLIKDAQHVVKKVSSQYLLNGPLEQLDAAKKGNILFYRETDLDPGEYSIDSIVYDATNNQASLSHGSLSIPEAESANLRVSSLIVVDKTQKATSKDPADNPFRVGDLLLMPNLGEPLHKAGSKGLSMFLTIYTAKAATAPPRMTIELYMGGRPAGQLPIQLPAADQNGRIQYTGIIPIDAFPAGEYELRATVTDGAAKAMRSERFTVQP